MTTPRLVAGPPPALAPRARRAMHAAARTRARAASRPLLFLAGHLVLAAALAPGGSAPIATLYAAAAVAVALGVAAVGPRTLVPAAAAYVAASDVLWRLTGAMVPWEGGKYVSALVLIVALVRDGGWSRPPVLPLVYFAVLLPSVLVVAAHPFVADAAVLDMMSFNLSGPLALAVGTWYLARTPLDEPGLRRALVGLLAPALTIGGVVCVRTLTATDLRFTAESSFATSGGFGPNQVSSLLGLGAFVALALALREPRHGRAAWMMGGIAAALALQAALTLSRGGLYAAGLAAIVTAVGLLRDPRARRRVLRGMVPAVALLAALAIPRLDTFTGGALGARFADHASSGRTAILREDLRIWTENPLLGVGPGQARTLRRTESRVSHTEYSRLLAEHGAFGAVALACLALMALRVVRRGTRTPHHAVMLGLLVWSLASMSHAGMRVAAFGFALALAQAPLLARAPRAAAGGATEDADAR